MKKNKFSLYFVFVSILTFLTIFLSIVQKSYFNLKNPQKIVEENKDLNNFDPNLDLSVLSIIESRDKNTNESFDFSVIKSGEPANTIPTPEPTIKPVLQLVPTPISIETVNPVEETVMEPFIESTESGILDEDTL